MFVYCVSNEPSDRCAKELGAFCVEVGDPDEIAARLRRAPVAPPSWIMGSRRSSRWNNYPLDAISAIDWAFLERIVLMKPPEYHWQNESRFAVPSKPEAQSADTFFMFEVGNHLAYDQIVSARDPNRICVTSVSP